MRERGETRAPRQDAGEIELDDAFWAAARPLGRRARKTSVHLRIDPDVVAAFKADGPGHLTRMADVLAAYARSRRP